MMEKARGETYHHNIHTSELRPDLSEDTDVCSVDHVRFKKLKVRDVRVGTLEFDDFADLGHLLVDERRVGVTLCVNQRENLDSFFPAIFSCQPSRGFWKEENGKEEEDSRDHLKPPGDTECGSSINEGAAI